LALGDIPGVTAPPLGERTELRFDPPQYLTMAAARGASPLPSRPLPPPPILRLTGPPPVLALTNFPETSAIVEVFGIPTAMTIANTGGPDKDFLFALSLEACQALRGAPNAVTALIAVLHALHPANHSTLQLDARRMSACVLQLGQGAGQLAPIHLIGLLNDLAVSDRGIFGSQIEELLNLLLSAATEPLTGTDLFLLVNYLKSPVEPLLPEGILKVVKFLRSRLSPKQILLLVSRLRSGATGITGQEIKVLFASMLTSTARICPFADLVKSMLTGGNEITAPEFAGLIAQLRNGNECDSQRVTELFDRLRAHLNPTETYNLCLTFLNAGVQPLTPKEFCGFTELALDPQFQADSIDSSQLMQLAQWLLTGLSSISPQAVCEFITTLLNSNKAKPKLIYGFVEFMVGSLNPLTPVQFLDVLNRLRNGGDSIELSNVPILCGRMKARGANPIQILALLDHASGANVFHPKHLFTLVNECHKETIGSVEMISICQQLVIAGPTGLHIAETLAVVKLLRNNNTGLSATQTVTLITNLCTAITPKQTEEVLGLLLSSGSIQPSTVLALYTQVCTGGSSITPVRLRVLCRRYLGALTAQQFTDLVFELGRMLNGLNPDQIDPLLIKLASSANGASPMQAHTLINALLAGGSALNPVEIFGMVDSLFQTLAVPTGLNGLQCFTLLDRLLTGDTGKNNALTPTQARQLVQAFRASFSPQNLNVLVTGRAQLAQSQITLSPLYLHARSQTANFIANAHAAIPHVTINELDDILGEAQVAEIRPAQIVIILQHLPNYYVTGGLGRAARIKRFIREATGQGATWIDIVTWLGHFIADGRAPFGAAYIPYAQAGVHGGPVAIDQWVDIGTPTHPYQIRFRVNACRINYFCNSHTFRYFNFATCGRADRISFWGAGVDRAAVILAITNALNNGSLTAMLWDAVNNPGTYVGTDAVNQYSEGDSGGEYNSHTNIFYLHHFHAIGGGGFSIKKEILKALALLFQP
jgi:hypothetical protein